MEVMFCFVCLFFLVLFLKSKIYFFFYVKIAVKLTSNQSCAALGYLLDWKIERDKGEKMVAFSPLCLTGIVASIVY